MYLCLKCGEKECGKERCDIYFSHKYISSHSEVEGQVFRLFNEYDHVCLGANEGLFSDKIINKLRGDALSQTWNRYAKYIGEYRKEKGKENAWMECDKWLKRMRSL